MSERWFTTDDIAASKRFLIEGYGVREVADALGLSVNTVQGVWEGRTYRQVVPLQRHKMGANLTDYVVKRNAQRLRLAELRDALAELELESTVACAS